MSAMNTERKNINEIKFIHHSEQDIFSFNTTQKRNKV